MMVKRYSINLEREDFYQYLLGFLCLIVYAGSLLFPLMDKDAAHHANIALNMLQRDDYTSLIDRHTDYLDKPHFLFWISAISFKIFGVNTFAYRLPAVLCALLSIYSTYRLAKHLSNKTTAKLAAIMLATAEGFILSINDARMETPLMAAIIFGLWQLIVFIDNRKLGNIILASVGIAMAFSTKGWIGPAITFIAAFFYILLNKKWNILLVWKTWMIIPLLAIFISPVLYAYYQQFNLHPEKVVRNMDHISGIKFILWDQNFERFGGDNFIKGGRNSSVFFLYHTFLWAFFPWCIAAYIAVVYWLRRMIWFKKWRYPFNFAALAFAFILFFISFSKFKMPHYIFMLLPLAALFTAPYLRLVLSYRKGIRFYYPLHLVLACLVIVAIIILNYYFFPPRTIAMQILGPIAIIGLIWSMIRKDNSKGMKVMYMTVCFAIAVNFFMNYNFFPGLMKYQGGNELAFEIKKENLQIDDKDIYLLDVNAHSFDFYRGYNHEIIEKNDLAQKLPAMKDKYFLLGSPMARGLETDSFIVRPVAIHTDYNVARMKLKFLNPKTRMKLCDTLMLAQIEKK
ncbi:MAG: glycosyltransferase family 39 protein [Chitinophagaceae bacterium]